MAGWMMRRTVGLLLSLAMFFPWQSAAVQRPRKDRRSSLILYLYSQMGSRIAPEIISEMV
jgi:hypothetical protein